MIFSIQNWRLMIGNQFHFLLPSFFFLDKKKEAKKNQGFKFFLTPKSAKNPKQKKLATNFVLNLAVSLFKMLALFHISIAQTAFCS